MAERLAFIAEFRAMLSQANLDVPIHIFGGLDPLMTPLYFWAGADVFDGLSWLRYAYGHGMSLYAKAFISTEFPHNSGPEAYPEMRKRNIRTLADLQISMQQFLSSRDLSAFGPVKDTLRSTWEACATPTN